MDCESGQHLVGLNHLQGMLHLSTLSPSEKAAALQKDARAVAVASARAGLKRGGWYRGLPEFVAAVLFKCSIESSKAPRGPSSRLDSSLFFHGRSLCIGAQLHRGDLLPKVSPPLVLAPTLLDRRCLTNPDFCFKQVCFLL